MEVLIKFCGKKKE